jgi:hypothetical protein
MRQFRLKSLARIASAGIGGLGWTSFCQADFQARAQAAVPAVVLAVKAIPTPPDQLRNRVLKSEERGPLATAIPSAAAPGVTASRPDALAKPELSAVDKDRTRPDTNSGLPSPLALQLKLPDLPPLAPAPPLAIPDLTTPAEPIPRPGTPTEAVHGISDQPAVGAVTVGGQPVSFDKLSALIGGGEGTATQVLTGGCPSCGTAGGGGCVKCEPVPTDRGPATRVVGRIYEALCCPDPCYQPKWVPLADTAFFTPSARPVSHTKLQWQYTRFGRFPDRGEYFWARADGNGKGPKPVAALGIPRVDTHELSQYTETATGPGFSAYFVTPYRSVNPTFADPSSAAGFADMTIGTKSVLMDSELFLLTLQFQTTLPLGNAAKGLGTGHVSLEPSLLFGLRVSPKSYLQGQIAQWIPLGGDPTYSGAMLHYHLAYNHTLWQPLSQVQLIGTFEMHGYSWQDGGFTDPATGFRNASGSNILQLGPGLRMFYCDKYDFGVGSAFGVTGKNSVGQQLRFEMRIRY